MMRGLPRLALEVLKEKKIQVLADSCNFFSFDTKTIFLALSNMI
jgi:hypothetical protein